MVWKPNKYQRRYLEVIIAMSIDSLESKGVDSADVFINNLRTAANLLEGKPLADALSTTGVGSKGIHK